MPSRHEPLPVKHGEPAHFTEKIPGPRLNLASFNEQLDLLGERVRDAHMLAVTPELRVLAFRHLVVGDDEVADGFVLKAHLLVEAVDKDGIEFPRRKEV